MRTSIWSRLDELLGRRVSMRALALLRICIGPIVLLHLEPFLSLARDGVIYRDTFWEPYLPWYPELPRWGYVGVLLLAVAGAVLTSLGLWTRASTVTTFVCVAYVQFLSTTNYHHNRAYLLIVLAALAVAPCGRELSLDAWFRRRRGRPPLDPRAPAWPLWLLRFEASLVYGASGLSKLVNPEWFGGTVTWDRIMTVRNRVVRSPLPDWAVSLLSDRTFHTYAAKVIVLTELFIALGLWWRATRYAAVWVAVCFHVAIQVSASVQVFSYLAIAALVIWAVPSTRDRTIELDLTAPGPARWARWISGLDWLARFRIVGAPPGAPLRVEDRNGTILEGPAAAVLVASRLPLTAWFALPLRLLPRARRPARTRIPRTDPALTASGGAR